MHLDDSGSTEQSQPDGFARNLPKNLMTHFTHKLYAVFSSLFAEATLCKTGDGLHMNLFKIGKYNYYHIDYRT